MAFGAYNGNFVSFNIADGFVNWAWTATYAGNAQMIAATSGNGLTVRDGNQVARLAPSGVATYDTWTGNDIQYAYGDMWLARASSEARSALAMLWPWSIWSKPAQDGRRGPNPKVNVQVFKIQEANVDDTFIQTQVNFAVAYWQLYAGIILNWDGRITPQLGCDPPQGIPDNCAAPYDVYDLTVVKGNANDSRGLSEAVRRFASSSGVNYVFVQGFADSASPPDPNIALDTEGITPAYTDSQGYGHFHNLTIIRSAGVGQVIPAHETGHELQLEHVSPIWGLANLMCGDTGTLLDWLWLNGLPPWICSDTMSNELTDEQIVNARDAAGTLK